VGHSNPKPRLTVLRHHTVSVVTTPKRTPHVTSVYLTGPLGFPLKGTTDIKFPVINRVPLGSEAIKDPMYESEKGILAFLRLDLREIRYQAHGTYEVTS
jgi:hypothetical protein